jgi:hypothetical protein
LRARLLDEHRELCALAVRCEQGDASFKEDREAIRRLGNLLHDHIRWEERVLFEAVQRDHPEALAALMQDAVQIEAERPGSRARRGSCEPFT